MIIFRITYKDIVSDMSKHKIAQLGGLTGRAVGHTPLVLEFKHRSGYVCMRDVSSSSFSLPYAEKWP